MKNALLEIELRRVGEEALGKGKRPPGDTDMDSLLEAARRLATPDCWTEESQQKLAYWLLRTAIFYYQTLAALAADYTHQRAVVAELLGTRVEELKRTPV